MKRREFITLIGGAAAVAWPVAARAQQPAMPVIGYLGFTSPSDEVEMISSVRKGLREAGFDEGRNVSIEFRFAEGDVSRLPTFVAELTAKLRSYSPRVLLLRSPQKSRRQRCPLCLRRALIQSNRV